jgi:hypothetical protein
LVALALLLPIAGDILWMVAAICPPIARILTAPLSVGLNIVIPVIRVGRPPGLLPAALAFTLTLSG